MISKEEIRDKVKKDAANQYPDYRSGSNVFNPSRQAERDTYIAAALPRELKIAELEEEVRRLRDLLGDAFEAGRIITLYETGFCERPKWFTHNSVARDVDQYLSSITKQQ